MATGMPSIALGSELRCENGLVAAAHPLAAEAGIRALQAGGNVVDAAVATALALTVTDPGNNSLGGYGGFLLYAPRDSAPKIVNFNTRAPLAATPDMFTLAPDGEVVNEANVTGYKAVGVPGILAGLELAQRSYGRLELAQLLQPAIRLAEDGIEVNHLISHCTMVPHLGLFPETQAIFRCGGSPLKIGQRLVQKEYAETLRRIALHGPRLFYEGELGEAIVAHIRQGGGVLSMDDLAGYRATIEPAAISTFNDCSIASYPLEFSGSSCVFQILNLVEKAGIRSLGHLSIEGLELTIAALRRAYSDRSRVAAMPVDSSPTFSDLASKEWVNRPIQDSKPGHLPGGHTTHLCAVDRDRNFAVLTQTLGSQWFGSGVTVPGTGIILNCGMGLFDPVPGCRNSIAPGRQALTNMAGSVVYRGGKPWAATGTPGAKRIISMVAGFLLGLVEYDLSPQQCVAAPRVHAEGDGPVTVERTLPRELPEQLRRRGHKVGYHDWRNFFGPASAVSISPEGDLLGGADPRFPGALAGY